MSNHLDYEINKELGECYLFMGDLDRAREHYEKAAGSNGAHPDPYLGLATIAVQQGQLEAALSLYGKAAGIEASDKSLAGMGLVELELGRLDEAFGHFAAALDKNPENMVAICMAVQLGHKLGRLPEVVGHLENFLAVDPLKHDVRYALAGCLSALGRNQDAASHLDRILAAEPGHEAAQELLSQIAA